MVRNIQHENSFLLTFQNYYDSYCCHGGKTNEHYFLPDRITVQPCVPAISLCIYTCKYTEN